MDSEEHKTQFQNQLFQSISDDGPNPHMGSDYVDLDGVPDMSKLANKLLIFADAGVEFYSGTYAEYQRDQEESVAASSSSIFAVAQTVESPQREPTTTASTNPASTTPKRERLLVAKKRAKSR